MEVVVAVALEEVSAMVRGVVPAQEVGKVQVITADQMALLQSWPFVLGLNSLSSRLWSRD
jgi:hypothetical protein